jgi:hypothetical protein
MMARERCYKKSKDPKEHVAQENLNFLGKYFKRRRVYHHGEQPNSSQENNAAPVTINLIGAEPSIPAVARSLQAEKASRFKPLTSTLPGTEDDEIVFLGALLVPAPCLGLKRKRAEQDSMSGIRRNPKRKAHEASAAVATATVPDNPLEEALAPIGPQEIEEWEGWVEFESEPAFFNIILRDLGVKNVKIKEIFSIDEESLAILPYVENIRTRLLCTNPYVDSLSMV